MLTPSCDPVLKKKLEEVRVIRDFASKQLGLPDNESYRSYADLQRPFVTWNVFAAPEFSLQTHNWCMFIVVVSATAASTSSRRLNCWLMS